MVRRHAPTRTLALPRKRGGALGAGALLVLGAGGAAAFSPPMAGRSPALGGRRPLDADVAPWALPAATEEATGPGSDHGASNGDHGASNGGSGGGGGGGAALLSELAADLKVLSSLRPPVPSADFSAPLALTSAGSSYTALWTDLTWRKHALPPHVRYYRHVRRWKYSTSARKILPAVMASSLYSLAMAFALRHVRVGRYQLGAMTEGASAAAASLGMPLALLLTLRANASLGRLNEARQLMGRMILRGRNLASYLRVYVLPTDPGAAVLAARYLAVFPWACKALVRSEPQDGRAKVYEAMLGPEGAAWLLSRSRQHVAIVLRLRQIIASAASTSSSRAPPGRDGHFYVPHASMERALDDLDAVAGGCERLLSSPIPPTYSRHLSRIMFMYLALLPFSLVASGSPSLGAMVASALASYVLVGIDEIGMEVENPFPVLPMQQLCGALQDAVGEAMACELPPVGI